MRVARTGRARHHPPAVAAVVHGPFESRCRAVDGPERRRAVLGEAHGRAVDEVGVEILRPRRLRPDAAAPARGARAIASGGAATDALNQRSAPRLDCALPRPDCVR